MKLDDVQNLIDLMNKHGLTEIEIEEKGVRISIKKGMPAQVIQTVAPVQTSAKSEGLATAKETVSTETTSDYNEIKAPFVGTFYRAPSPDSEPYVTVGQKVDDDTVVCIIEAMKVMNEIKAEASGVITEIFVENAEPVEYAQPLFKIQKV